MVLDPALNLKTSTSVLSKRHIANLTGKDVRHIKKMQNATDIPIHGWVASGKERGSIDILWSCLITVVLCCWVSVYPNAGSPTDKWYHYFIDKFNLFCISVLGPDFLFGIAFGQFSSARRSMKLFNEDKPLGQNFRWTYTYAFFVDMGGIHLKSPDFPQGFPINAHQLHYLIMHNHVDPPNMEAMDISERNSADTLSRLITIFQALWFFVREIQRFHEGLPITTLELTTVSFTLVMFATSATWYFKPSITRPQFISTKNGKTAHEIRESIRQNTHPMLPPRWYRTPLEYIGHDRFGINVHWSYYTRIAQMLHIPLFARPVTSQPWDRFPSDIWLCPDFTFSPIASCVLLGFSGLFLVAWDFYFPTHAEKVLWRICSVYHAVFSIYGGIYFLAEMVISKRRPPDHYRRLNHSEALVLHDSCDGVFSGSWRSFSGKPSRWRNISMDEDPEMTISLRVLIPVSVLCILYILSRGYIYMEDFASLRSQPAGVYIDVKILPFLGQQ